MISLSTSSPSSLRVFIYFIFLYFFFLCLRKFQYLNGRFDRCISHAVLTLFYLFCCLLRQFDNSLISSDPVFLMVVPKTHRCFPFWKIIGTFFGIRLVILELCIQNLKSVNLLIIELSALDLLKPK